MLDAYDAYNVTASTAAAVGQDQTKQIARQLEIKVEKNQLANPKILKTTSRNVAKQLKMRQKTRVTTRARKTAETAIKQIVAQKLQAKKKNMQKRKQIILQKVGYKLQTMRQTHEKAMKA